MTVKNQIISTYEIRLAIEIDGNSHDNKQDYDYRRQYELEQYDVNFLRFTDRDIEQQMSSVLSILRDKIEKLSNNEEETSP